MGDNFYFICQQVIDHIKQNGEIQLSDYREFLINKIKEQYPSCSKPKRAAEIIWGALNSHGIIAVYYNGWPWCISGSGTVELKKHRKVRSIREINQPRGANLDTDMGEEVIETIDDHFKQLTKIQAREFQKLASSSSKNVKSIYY